MISRQSHRRIARSVLIHLTCRGESIGIYDAMSIWRSVPRLSIDETGAERSASTISLMLRNDERLLRLRKCDEDDDDIATARLHVFFISIDETPEQLNILRRNNGKMKSNTARSKISATTLSITPVDAVADRVV